MEHSDWILEESPSCLSIEEVEALRKDLADMSIQCGLDDIGVYLTIFYYSVERQ